MLEDRRKDLFKDYFKNLIKSFNIQPGAIEQLASDRFMWRSTYHTEAYSLEISLNLEKAAKRVHLHQQVQRLIPLNMNVKRDLQLPDWTPLPPPKAPEEWPKTSHLIWGNVVIDYDGLIDVKLKS